MEKGLLQSSWPAVGKDEKEREGSLRSWPAVGKEEEEEGSLRSWPAVVEEEEEEEELLQSWPAVTYIWIGGEKIRLYSPEISVK